jgi:hypothetical protein
LASQQTPLRTLKYNVSCCARTDLLREQVVHRFETRVTRSAEGKTGKVFVGDLSDENALDLAGKIVSEAFLYTVQRLPTPLFNALSVCAQLLRAPQGNAACTRAALCLVFVY